MKICLIGNLNHFVPKTCGQITKTQLYYNVLKKEYGDLDYIDLSSKFYILYFFMFTKLITKKYDLIIALPGPRSCHYILPALVKSNKSKHCRIIYSAIGPGYFIDSFEDALNNKRKFIESIRKIDVYTFQNLDACMFELKNISELHKKNYLCKNAYVIPNFRDIKIYKKNRIFSKNDKPLKIIFLSRVCEKKGIFDLINVIKEINMDMIKVTLDIFGGDDELNSFELNVFNTNLNNFICYKGHIDNDKVINLFYKYDVFCFPTKYFVEGIPGAIIESFISGTPIISSDFIQAKQLIKDGINGLIYKFDDKDDLKNKILLLYNNRKLLNFFSSEAYKTGNMYTYSYWKTKFLNIIKGNI